MKNDSLDASHGILFESFKKVWGKIEFESKKIRQINLEEKNFKTKIFEFQRKYLNLIHIVR